MPPLPALVFEGTTLPSDVGSGSGLGGALGWDKTTLVAGASGGIVGSSSGSAHVYRRLPSGFQQTAKLVPEGSIGGVRFGQSVAIDGDTLVVGARGFVYVFERTGDRWNQAAQLGSPSPDNQVDSFAKTVDIAGDTILATDDTRNVGAEPEAGAVVVYRRTAGGDWKQEATLTAAQPHRGDTFGSAAALKGNTIAVGAPKAGVEGGAQATGAFYVFERTGSHWSEAYRFVPEGADALTTLGDAVALDPGENEAAASAPGQRRAYVFARKSGHWQPAGTLEAPAPRTANEKFGGTLSLHGRYAAVNLEPSLQTPGPGTIYVYQHDRDGWHCMATLQHPKHQSGDDFGRALVLSEGTLMVGAPHMRAAAGDVLMFVARAK